MGRTVIGITGNEIEDAGEKLHYLPISYTPAGYVKAVQEVGGLPLIIPVSSPETVAEYIAKIDKLILTGGQNVSPKWYGKKNEATEAVLLEERDAFELALFREALKQKKSIFAVCRGLQLVNVALGGSLHQKIPTGGSAIAHMQAPIPANRPTHTIFTKKYSILQKIYGKEAKVNSFHFQAIHQLGKGLATTAWSEDGGVEGVESTTSSMTILGVQWHPDFSYKDLPQEKSIFEYVVHQL